MGFHCCRSKLRASPGVPSNTFWSVVFSTPPPLSNLSAPLPKIFHDSSSLLFHSEAVFGPRRTLNARSLTVAPIIICCSRSTRAWPTGHHKLPAPSPTRKFSFGRITTALGLLSPQSKSTLASKSLKHDNISSASHPNLHCRMD